MSEGRPVNTRGDWKKLTTTSSTTVYTAKGGNTRETLNAVLVSNITGTAATVTVEHTVAADSATYSIETATVVPPNGSICLRPLEIPLVKDDAIKATAGTANALHVLVLLSESVRA